VRHTILSVGKVLSERPANVEGLQTSLGRIWCPLKGLKCKDLGSNIFQFVFLQASGKRKALESGPWKFNNDLVVMEDFDPNKARDDYAFDSIPIWVRVLKLPLGRMNRATGEVVGDAVGEFLGVDVGDDDTAVGEYLRVKVKLNITAPLLRGLMVQVGESNADKWCPFEYEYLPEFCYTCGVLGHEYTDCSIKLKRGEKQQYGRWLRAMMPKKQTQGERSSWEENRNQRNPKGFGFGNRSGGSGSDSRSWRKETSSGGDDNKISDKNEEVTSPMKTLVEHNLAGTQKRLEFQNEEGKNKDEEAGKGQSLGAQQVKNNMVVNTLMQDDTHGAHMVANQEQKRGSGHLEGLGAIPSGKKEEKKDGRFKHKFQKKGRSAQGDNKGEKQVKMLLKVGEKRGAEPMEIEEEDQREGKKVKGGGVAKQNIEAGLSVQPCKDQ
jgi:hypothetical protein